MSGWRPRVGSLCSGCGGFDLGLEGAGFEVAYQVEIDYSCQGVLAYHWPDVPRLHDLTEVQPEQLEEFGPVDLIAGGTPCQDLSVAGRREGLGGERSGLFFDFVRIADASPSSWVLWENVDGALSSESGEDFAIVLRELTGFWPSVPADGWRNSGFCVGPKRWAVWRVLDSEYFGVAQRRYRLFVVAGPGACPRPEVLLEPECLPGNPPARREEGTVSSPLLAGGAGGRGYRIGADEAERPSVVGSLTSGYGERSYSPDAAAAGHYVAAFGGNRTGGPRDTAAALLADGGKGDFETETFVVAAALTTRPWADNEAQESRLVVSPCLRGEGHDGSEDGTGRHALVVQPVPFHLAQITSGENRSNPQPGDPAPTLNADPRLAVAFTERGRDDGRSLEWLDEEVAYTLRGPGGGGSMAMVAYQCHGSNVGPIGTLRSGNGGVTGGVPFIINAAESCATQSHAREAEIARCLDSTGGFASQQGGTVVAQTLTAAYAKTVDRAGSNGAGPSNVITTARGVRRLTPQEYERLQGYPDDWTLWGRFTHSRAGKPYRESRVLQLKDSPRYRMVGNGVTRQVAEWIGKRILAAMHETRRPSTAISVCSDPAAASLCPEIPR